MPEIALQWCVLEAYEDDVRSGIGHAFCGAKMNPFVEGKLYA